MILDPDLALKLLFVAGITNLLFLFLVFFSCRCLGLGLLPPSLLEKEWFKKFYFRHCYFWWGFFASVLLHTLLAFSLFGNPF